MPTTFSIPVRSKAVSTFLHGSRPSAITSVGECRFVASAVLVPQTIKSYLSAVRHFHIVAGHGDPFTPGSFPCLQYVLRGVKRAPRQSSRPWLPITPHLLRTIKTQWAARPLIRTQWCSGLPAAWGFRVYESRGVYGKVSWGGWPGHMPLPHHTNPSMVKIQHWPI